MNAMMKPFLLALAVFFAAGTVMEHVLDAITDPRNEAAVQATFDRAVSSQSHFIPPLHQAQPTPEVREKGENMNLVNCSGREISRMRTMNVEGTVLEVLDGDTLRMAIGGESVSVRLWGIDAPESDQPRGDQAKNHLARMVNPNTRIPVHIIGTDAYERLIVTLGEDDETAVNFRMVLDGMAYHYREYAPGNRCLAEAQKLAQQRRSGVWSQDPRGEHRPWDHRRERTINQAEKSA